MLEEHRLLVQVPINQSSLVGKVWLFLFLGNVLDCIPFVFILMVMLYLMDVLILSMSSLNRCTMS